MARGGDAGHLLDHLGHDLEHPLAVGPQVGQDLAVHRRDALHLPEHVGSVELDLLLGLGRQEDGHAVRTLLGIPESRRVLHQVARQRFRPQRHVAGGHAAHVLVLAAEVLPRHRIIVKHRQRLRLAAGESVL